MKKAILLDGPMGTELDRRGGDTSLPLWSARALIDTPELVKQIHLDYIAAGADVITTNTFRTQSYTLEKAEVAHSSEDLTRLAVELAIEAKSSTDRVVKIAGSIAPIEDCYSPHLTPDDQTLARNFETLIATMVDAGVDILLIETMNSMRETNIALEIASRYRSASQLFLPIWLSFTCDNAGIILSGESWAEVLPNYRDRVDLISVNCSSVEGTRNALRQIQSIDPSIPFGFYPNFGTIDEKTGWTSDLVGADYEELLIEYFSKGPSMIGTCCGATPKNTRYLREKIDTSF
jgi:homocysteine S-methyltransferase